MRPTKPSHHLMPAKKKLGELEQPLTDRQDDAYITKRVVKDTKLHQMAIRNEFNATSARRGQVSGHHLRRDTSRADNTSEEGIRA